MDLLHEIHQAHFFTTNNDIPATPQILSQLLKALGGFGVMPTYGKTINAKTGGIAQFVVMLSTDEKLRIEFPPDRIIIATEGKTSKEFEAFISPILQSIASQFPTKKASRVSIITTKIYGDSAQSYNALYQKLFTYKSATPFEWDNRIAVKDELNGEELNIISTIRRCQVASNSINEGNYADVISSEVDVNTSNNNSTPRFSITDADKILSQLFIINQDKRAALNRYFESQ